MPEPQSVSPLRYSALLSVRSFLRPFPRKEELLSLSEEYANGICASSKPGPVKWDNYNLGLILVAQLVKNPPAMRETWVRSLGWEDPLEKGKAAHSSILTWRIPRTGYSVQSQRVGHD